MGGGGGGGGGGDDPLGDSFGKDFKTNLTMAEVMPKVVKFC